MKDFFISTIILARDFRPGGNRAVEMQRGAADAERTIAVRVGECERKALLKTIISIALVGLDEGAAQTALLE